MCAAIGAIQVLGAGRLLKASGRGWQDRPATRKEERKVSIERCITPVRECVHLPSCGIHGEQPFPLCVTETI